MTGFLAKIDKILDVIYQYGMIITGTAVCLLVMINALLRYIFKLDFFGSEEITLFVAFWLYFIGSAAAARENTHINANMVTLITKNQKMIKLAELVKCVLSFIVCVMVTRWCVGYVWWSYRLNARSNVFRFPNAIAQLPIALSFALWCCYLLRDIICCVKSFGKDGE